AGPARRAAGSRSVRYPRSQPGNATLARCGDLLRTIRTVGPVVRMFDTELLAWESWPTSGPMRSVLGECRRAARGTPHAIKGVLRWLTDRFADGAAVGSRYLPHSSSSRWWRRPAATTTMTTPS